MSYAAAAAPKYNTRILTPACQSNDHCMAYHIRDGRFSLCYVESSAQAAARGLVATQLTKHKIIIQECIQNILSIKTDKHYTT